MSSLSDKCVIHYKMNDSAATTTVTDSMGNYNGTAQQNTNLIATTGKVGGAFTFNGSSDYIDAGNSLESVFQGSFAFSFWVKPTDGRPTLNMMFLGTQINAGTDQIYAALLASGVIRVVYKSDNDLCYGDTAAAVFDDGAIAAYYHIVVVAVADTQLYIYVNGALQDLTEGAGSGVATGVTFADYVNTQNFYVGAYNQSGSDAAWFDGSIDNVMVFNDALTQEEITLLYNGGDGTEHLGYPQNSITEKWDGNWGF